MYKSNKIIGVLCFVLALCCYAQAQSGISWTAAPSLLTPRDSAAAGISGNGTIFVLGGASASPLSVDSLAANAPAWTAASPIPQVRLAPGGLISPFNPQQMFVFGGKSNGRALKETFFYDTVTGAISNQASMKTLRYKFAYASSGGGIYAFGGLDTNNQPTAAVEIYAPGNNRWGLITPMPEARSNFAATNDNSGSILTFGGSIAGSAATNTVYRFQGTTWTVVAPMPVATRDSAVVAGANNLIYVIGGSSGTASLNTVQIYDVVHDSWRLGTPLTLAVSSASAVIERTGKIVVMGGIDSANNSSPLVWTSPQADAPPVINSFPNTFAIVGQQYSTLISAAGNPTPTYSLISAPAGMTINSVNGVISWTPDLTQIGIQNVTARASNSAGDNDQTFSISVRPFPPDGLAVSNIAANSATLNWNPLPSQAGAVTYNAYQRFCGGRSGCRYVQVFGGLSATTTTLNGLASGGFFGFAVTAVVNGAESLISTPVFFSTLRVDPPTNVVITDVTQNSVSLAWTAPAASPVPVVAYRVFDAGVVMADNLTQTAVTINGLTANSTHTFYVVSLDAAFNMSFIAVAPSVTTSSLPVVFHNSMFPRPANLGGGFYPETLAAVNGGSLTLVSTDAHSSAQVNFVVSVTGMPRPTFSMVSGPSGMTIDAVTGVVSWTNINSPIGTFTATVRGTNNVGSTDFSFNYTVYAAGTDLLSPTEPAYFQTNATNITQTSATINWSPSTDNVGVVGYRLYMSSPPPPCGRLTGCPPPPTNITPTAVVDGNTTSVTVNNLIPNSRYGMWVVAFDAAGNTSFVTAAVRPAFSTLP